MPKSDGFEGLKLIKEFDSKAKVIMVSAMAQKQLVLQALQLGALNFVIKPFQEEKVQETVNDILK